MATLDAGEQSSLHLAPFSMTPDLPPPPLSSLDPSLPSSTGMQPNVAAGLAILFTLVGGLVFYLIEKQSQFVRYWAKQGLTLGILWMLYYVAAYLLVLLLVRILPLGLLSPLAWILWLINLGFWALAIYGAVQAFGNKTWNIPYVSDLSKKFFRD